MKSFGLPLVGVFINTGFQAGAGASRERKAVSTAFVFPVQPVAINELFELLRERADAMMLLLLRDISRDLIDI